MPKLENAQHEEFCQRWIIEFNGTKAAIASGYSKKTARVQASQLLTKLNISERIAELLKDRSERTKITQDMVIRELAILGFSDFRHYGEIVNQYGIDRLRLNTFDKMGEGRTRAIKSISEHVTKDGVQLKFKLHGKERPLELLGKHTGLFEDVGDKLAKIAYELSEKFMPSAIKKNAKK